ncbi:AMP-binding protein [Acrocarpospora catenulata]|uniref:AMP-binding protein n=1 Tax=Acrocarpospora catenulata TaxID=2836182 RepID=UPI001BD9F0DA|nr:AMP-binding protein [Acrocarpospora catenulata]
MHVPLTTQDFLARASLSYAASAALVDEPGPFQDGGLGRLTYGQLAKRARAMAAGLDARGMARGSRIAVLSHNSGRLLESFFGVTSWGRVLVPVNFRLARPEIRYIVEHSGADLLLVDPEVRDSVDQDLGIPVLMLGEESDAALMAPGEDPRPWADPDETATATINYTSGTTARPKGVQLTHRNLWVNAVTFALHTAVTDRDVYLHTLPMFHANGWGMPFALTGLGVQQVVLRKVDGDDILARVRDHGVTLMCGAPAVLAAVIEAAQKWDGPVPGAGRVRVVCAGAPPPTRIIEEVENRLGWELIQIYGLTETSPLLTINRRRARDDERSSNERARRLSRAGTPALGVTLQVAEDGELLVRGNVVFESYWQQPEETSQAQRDGWFHTGDGGHLDEEGFVTIVDRKKDVIISGGENVSSIEVEDCLFSHPAVAEAAVISVPHEKWGETVKAVVVLKSGATASPADLIAHCKAALAGYKAPTSVDFVEALPRNATGKVQKFKLREPYWAGRERLVN